MNTKDDKLMLPYLIIAKFNDLRKDNPDDINDMVWVSDKGERYVLTPKGFVSAIQYSYKSFYEQAQKELERVSEQYLELKKKSDSHVCRVVEDNDVVGKKLRKRIKSLINSNNYRTIEEKFEAVKKYLKEK